MSMIKAVHAIEILDSRGVPTVEVTVYAKNGSGTASVPSGASTGKHEAVELRDNNHRYGGKGVLKAINNIHNIIAPKLIGTDCTRQREIDYLMRELDKTENKSKLGSNAILAVSLACAAAGANSKNKNLYQYINSLLPLKRKMKLPRPYFNILNGGKHADNSLAFQEFMVVPRMNKFSENLRVASEIYHKLKYLLDKNSFRTSVVIKKQQSGVGLLNMISKKSNNLQTTRKTSYKKYGEGATNVGDEGGFAPVKMKTATEVLSLLNSAISKAGYSGKVGIAIDAAASEFYKNNKYYVDDKVMSNEQLLKYYIQLVKKFPIISIEDPFEQEDFESFAALNEAVNVQIVGDDLTVTNKDRLQKAISQKSANCLLLKVNQIGTLTESLDAAKMAFDHDWNVMVSHRSGETEDSFIADLAVGLGCGQIKSGAPCRGERTAKYNQLLRIEKVL